MYEPQPSFSMSASNTFDLSGPIGTEPTAARRTPLTKAQKAVLIGVGGSAILSGSALAWGMSKNGSMNPFAAEVPAGSDEPDIEGELDEEVPTEAEADLNSSPHMPAESTGVAAHVPVGTLVPVESPETPPTPENTGTAESIPNAPVGAASNVPTGTGFEQAFAEARQEVGPGGYFVWNGNVYNTFFKEEWEEMSPTEQQEYVAAVQEDRLETWQETEMETVHIRINDPGDGVVLGNPDEKPEVPVEPTETEWIALNVDGHRVDLGNTDADDTAELAIVDGQVALVDMDEDGTFDVGGRIDPKNGQVAEWVELAQPINAPSMSDLRGAEQADPERPLYTSGESGDFGDDFNNQAGTSEFV